VSRPGTPTDGINLAFLAQALVPYATQIALAAGLAGKLNTSGGAVSGLLSFSGTDTPGLQLKVLTASQITALGEIGNGSMLLDSTNNEVDVRINGVTQALISNRGGQTINGALAITGVLDLRKGAAANVLQFSNTAFLRTDTSQLSIFDTGIGRSNIALWRFGNFVVGSTTLIAASSGADATGNVVDTSFSRNAAGVWQMGTTAANASGSLLLTNLTASGTGTFDTIDLTVSGATRGRWSGNGGIAMGNARGIGWAHESTGTSGIGTAFYLASNGTVQLGTGGINANGNLSLNNINLGGSLVFPELVTNGGFDTDTAWAKGTGWTISGGLAVATGVVSFADIQQNLPAVELGRTYVVTFTIGFTSGALAVFLGVSGSSLGFIAQVSVAGTYSFLFHKNNFDTARTILFRAQSAFTGTIDNVSVRRAF
jgi:hypothetical protein